MDLRKFNEFMMKFAPMLMKQKMSLDYERERNRMWLERTLEEYAAWAETQGKIGEANFIRNNKERLADLTAKGLKGIDRPELLFQPRLEEAGIELPFEPTVSHEEAIEPTQVLMGDTAKLYPGISPEEIEAIVRGVPLKGSDSMQKILESVVKARKEEAERGLTARKVTVEEKKLPIREAELKAGGVPKRSALENKLDSKLKERWGIIEKLAKAETEEEWGISTKATQVLKNRIEQLNKSIRSLKEKTGTDPDERHAKGAEFLKSKGYSKKDLLEDERVMSWITENKLTVWILLEYF